VGNIHNAVVTIDLEPMVQVGSPAWHQAFRYQGGHAQQPGQNKPGVKY